MVTPKSSSPWARSITSTSPARSGAAGASSAPPPAHSRRLASSSAARTLPMCGQGETRQRGRNLRRAPVLQLRQSPAAALSASMCACRHLRQIRRRASSPRARAGRRRAIRSMPIPSSASMAAPKFADLVREQTSRGPPQRRQGVTNNAARSSTRSPRPIWRRAADQRQSPDGGDARGIPSARSSAS